MEFDRQLAIKCTESFSLASGLGCALVDKKGKVIHACGADFTKCRVCEAANRDQERCFATHRYGVQEAERFGGKYIYFCAMGLTCFTSPILGEDGVNAQITAGPFLMVDEQDYVAYDLEELEKKQPERIPRIMEQVRALPYVEAKRVGALSELLFMSVAFLNNVADANRMMENEQSNLIQGQISDYLFHVKRAEGASPYPFREEKQFLHALSRGDRAQAQALLNGLLGHIMFESGGDMAQIRSRVHELLILLSRTVIESGGASSYVEGCLQQYRQQIPRMQSMEELSLWLSKVVRALIDTLFSNNTARHSDLIYRTIQYLQTHYAHKLTLEEVADHVHISPTYLSRVFKREVGSSMVDYLNHIRIEKSKELLAQPQLRLIEVALQSGFESQSYFNRMFKQACDMTPQQYRNLMSNDIE